jgi:hypothetical protein
LCVLNRACAVGGSVYQQIGETKQEIILHGIQQGFMKFFIDKSLEGCKRMNLFLI